jgi:hypothetical protein
MQENRLSSVLVVAPATEQDLTPSTEGEVSTTTTSVPIDTESKYQTTASDAWYKQTETIMPVTNTNTNTEISTTSYVEREDFSYKPYFIPSLQVTAYTSVTTDDNVTISTESFGSTTENSELTSPKNSTISEGFHVGTLSVEDDILLSTVAANEPTTESWFQETIEGDMGLGNHEGNHHEVSGVREANKQGDANEQGSSNTDEKLLEGDNTRSESEDGTLAEGHISEGVSVQGNDSDSNAEDESKNADDNLQVDNNNSSQMQSASAGGGDNPYLLHTEPPDYGGSDAVALDYTSDVVTTEATGTPATDGTHTSPSTLC